MLIESASYYGTLTECGLYFEQRLNTQAWDNAVVNDRTAALYQATRAIDRLNFAGETNAERNDTTQELQFPRGDDTVVPVEICAAAYECVLKFLEGIDIDMEARDIGLGAITQAGSRTVYKEGFVPEHLRAGIPSVEAWLYLRPFLRDPGDFSMSRVS
jgi:hypothetical protein